jgi:hypothetical protein
LLLRKNTTVLHLRLKARDIIAPPEDILGSSGKTGVRKLGYIEYWCFNEHGEKIVIEGVFRAREYPNDESAGNPMVVWDLRKGQKNCQACSDRIKRPILKLDCECSKAGRGGGTGGRGGSR